MSSVISRFSTAETVVFWDLSWCPIPNGLSPASISDNINLALKNIGYTGRVSIFAYSGAKQIEKDFESAGINLIELDSEVNVGGVMDDAVYSWWGVIQRCEPKNLLVIGVEDVAMYAGFVHLDRNDNNLLLAHPQYTTEEIPCTASSIWLWASLSSGGSPFHNQSVSLQKVTPSPTTFAAETCVLWDLDACPISEDLSPCSIADNIKSALKNMGYAGQMSIVAYTEHIEKDFESDGINLIRLETNLAKYERMFFDICLWGRRNEPSNLMVISSKNIFDSDFVMTLGEIRTEGNNILLALPHHPSKLLRDTASSIWRWNTLSAGGLPLDNQSQAAETGVFWDLDHCPIPNDLSPCLISDNIKSALNNMGYTGQVSIVAYTDTDTEQIKKDFESTGIKLVRLGDTRSNRRNRGEILSDMCMWACHHRYKQTNLMLISKDVSEDASYVTGLLTIKSQAHNILLAQPLNASGLLRRIPSSIWLWTSLSIGGLPLDNQTGGSQVVTPSPTIGAPLDDQSGIRPLHLVSKKMKRWMKPCTKKRKSRAITHSKD